MRVNPYLEGSSQPEDAVVRFFGWQPLQGKQDGVVLFGYQVIGPVSCINGSFPPHARLLCLAQQLEPAFMLLLQA